MRRLGYPRVAVAVVVSATSLWADTPPPATTAAHVVGSSSSSSSGMMMVAMATQRRGYVNAFYRLPLLQNVPTHSPSGEEIDQELFIAQVRHLFVALKHTQLVENIFEMKSLPYFDATFPADIAASLKSVVFVMPKYGREHRTSEMSETLRYLRGSGANNEFNSTMQDARGATAHGGDFVATTHGLLMGWGSSRTNKIAMDAMTGGSGTDGATGFASVHAIEQAPDAPPLADLIAFSGSRTLLAKDNRFGHDAATQAIHAQSKVPWQVVPIQSECDVLSFAAGSLPVFDVLCDQDFTPTMDKLSEAGLNPFPVEWTEPRKCGITMRSVCLIVRFSTGGGPGGFRDSMNHQASARNYHPSQSAKGGRYKHQQGQRTYGDQGAPLMAQLKSGEIPDPVYQPPPRYRPPMHRQGGLATRSTESNEGGEGGGNGWGGHLSH